MEIDIDKIKAFPVITFLTLFCGVFISGFLFIYVFNDEIFLSLDLFRLTALAVSITIPLFSINGFLILMGLTKDEENAPNNDAFHRAFAASMYLGSLMTIPVIYISILIGYFFELTEKQGILLAIIIEVTLLISVSILIFHDSSKTKKKNDSR